MSDYFGKNPNRNGHRPTGANPWEQDPFMAYDDPSLNAPQTDAPGDGDDMPGDAADMGGARPDFAAPPSGYAAPASGMGGSAYPPADDAYAPTRVGQPAYGSRPARRPSAKAHPVDAPEQPDASANMFMRPPAVPEAPYMPPMADASAAADEPVEAENRAAAAPAQTDAAANARAPRRNRRAGRMAPPEAAPEAPAGMPPFAAPAQQPGFDPFEAGDSETVMPQGGEDAQARVRQMEEETEQPPAGLPRRPAKPGERYTGARTAMPQGGRSPRPARPAGERPARLPEDAPVDERRMRSARPVDERRMSAPDDRFARPADDRGMGERPPMRPVQRPQRPQPAMRDMDEYDRDGADDRAQASARFDPRHPYPDARRAATINRPRYDFEEDDIPPPPRRGRWLVTLLVFLLVIGALLAAIVLPDWDGMGGTLGTTMGGLKESVTGVFDTVKSLISPEEAGVTSFTVSPNTATAPVELVFTVQAPSSVTDIRIVDADGAVLIAKTLSDSELLDGQIIKNSNTNIWTLHYTFDGGYSGVFTAQSQKKDGTWAEGITLDTPVVIEAPAIAEPVVQDFGVEPAEGEVPQMVTLTVVTSTDVNAVQVTNDYGDAVAEAYFNDAESLVDESENTRTWTLMADMEDAYTGAFYVRYQSGTDLAFMQSDFDASVTFGIAQAGADTADTAATAEPTPAPATATAAATATPTATPTASPTPEPTPVTTPEPTTVPILSMNVSSAALPDELKIDETVYEGTKSTDDYSRDDKVVLNDPFRYAIWDQSGVLTFRSGPFRQNAAFGTVEITSEAMTEMWKVAMEGYTQAKSSKLYGVTWPGQPVIVKWPTQLRALLDMSEDAKNKTALKEVMVGSQNGMLYFLDLVTGEATREAVDMGYPSNGVLSLQTNASPMLAIGQHISVLSKKTIDNGLHLFNLLNNKELELLDGRDKQMQSNYSGFNGAPLFDSTTGTMIVGGENGLLYTMEPGGEFDHIIGTLSLKPSYQKYKWSASGEKTKNTNIDGAVAMYGSYIYFADQTGILQCVDVNTLSPVWAADTGDNVDATIALDMDDAESVSLYTANTIVNQGRSGVCTIRRYDALTGEETWAYEVPDLTYTTSAEVGCYASPVVGDNSVDDLVFFTVTDGEKNATVYALKKATGDVVWSTALDTPTVSSPVAVYNLAGDAWLIQGESDGTLNMLDASTGDIVNTLQLEGSIEASPAVYRDVLVICTTGSDSSYIYGIKLE